MFFVSNINKNRHVYSASFSSDHIILTACITMPSHKAAPLSAMLGEISSPLDSIGPSAGPVAIDNAFEKSIKP